MATRHDVSRVPLQGGYVAKQCPVRAQNDVIRPGEPLPPSAFVERLFRRGLDFEAEIIAELQRLHPGAVVISEQGEDAEAATAGAMRARHPLIIGGRLPADRAGRRVGKPDVLVAAIGGGYRAVDVKNHMAITPSPPGRYGMLGLLSTLAQPGLEQAVMDEAVSGRKNEDDLLQLAHYQRMLEASGFAPAQGRLSGIIGTERQLVWYDLDVPVWRTPSFTQKTRLRSTMERYDFEFDFRLDIIAVAEQHKARSSVELLVVPVKISECESCPWWDHCRPQLESRSGDVSLLPRIGWTQWKIHHDHGTTNRAELAALDMVTAQLVAAGVDVSRLMSAAIDQLPNLPLTQLDLSAPLREKLSVLHDLGINTAADVSTLSGRTASYYDAGMLALPTQIDLARAALGPEPVYRRRGVGAVTVPRGGVEVDIDMESVEDGCYLWGALVSDRSGQKAVESGYRPFVTWEPMTRAAEAENSLRFWIWLRTIREAATGAGLTCRVYCYNANAENFYLRRLGLASGIEEEIELFIASDDWVDLLRVFDDHFITGHGSGLKVVAPLAGYRWDVAVHGGEESMAQHDVAVGNDDAASAAREWLLMYNRGDVEATRHLREWMASALVPPIEGVDQHRSVTKTVTGVHSDRLNATNIPSPDSNASLS